MGFAFGASSACSRPYVFGAGPTRARIPKISKRVLLVTALLAAVSGIPARVRAEEPADGEDDDQSVGVVLDNAAFEQRLAQSEALVRNAQPTVQVGGYVDFGFFVPQGNGSGYIEDFGHVYFPGYAGQFGWVFLGDILAPAINTRGEVADLGPAPGVEPLRQHQLARRAGVRRSTRSTWRCVPR